MPRAPDRTFSFDNDDEIALDANRRNYLSQDNNAFREVQPSSLPAYTDSPTRRYDNRPPSPPAHRYTPYQLSQSTGPFVSQTPRPQIAVNTRQAQEGGYGSQDLSHSASNGTASTITPGADNLGDRAIGGGMTGIALGVANTNERESGLEALRSVDGTQPARGLPPEHYDTMPTDTPYTPTPLSHSRDPFASPAPSRRSNPFEDERGDISPSPGDLTPRGYPSTHSIPMSEYPPQDVYENGRSSYTDNPYKRFSTAWDARVGRGDIDPNEIEDDGDDYGAPPVRPRRSMLGLNGEGTATAAEGAAATGGILGALGGLVGKTSAGNHGARDLSGQYGAVPGSSGPGFDVGVEKSAWLSKQASGRRRLQWIVGSIVILAIIGGIVGGVIAAVRSRNSSSSDDSSSSSESSAPTDSDLDKNSPEIQKLMNNPNLHKVFPGMDYTPFNAQYPACLTNPPSQDNVTMDIAVLSQLTNAVRLYGTDCNQTQMVLHAIDKLSLPDMKVWLGVWLDNNSTTSNRGLDAMYQIISQYGASPFAGVIVGNEVLYRKDMTEAQLSDLLGGVRTNFTNQKIDLDIATSDLGDNWIENLTENVDYVMSNIHPFFAGITAELAAGWTWDFWQEFDTILTNGTTKQNVISETGWPSGGGTDCGEATTCVNGSVAGIDGMNTYMETFVCQSLTNKTNYFWSGPFLSLDCRIQLMAFDRSRFEAFDEPWKQSLNTPGKEWEDKWGLMDPGRNLKAGLTIPNCGGQTV
ncbi:MAG: hypothetical protein ALECFALPRED_003840 [Alectoria fallacina]|uniref:glucan endo-1,3-beta-D-glucosidase n=1 Tax=Alectoria fallacina TaxID=1903189 RepID=A0A8H3EIG0_9LECA|nr:MAG: hypothetical protein ALECFALPRED_003840 [Alectoria fallacina]